MYYDIFISFRSRIKYFREKRNFFKNFFVNHIFASFKNIPIISPRVQYTVVKLNYRTLHAAQRHQEKYIWLICLVIDGCHQLLLDSVLQEANIFIDILYFTNILLWIYNNLFLKKKLTYSIKNSKFFTPVKYLQEAIVSLN